MPRSLRLKLALALWLILRSSFSLADHEAIPDSAEMAATLRDMIELPRVLESYRQRLFITPSEFHEGFAPQSAWGKEQFSEWEKPWRESFAALIVALHDNGRLAQAYTAAGLRMPVQQQYYQAPEYTAIDRLLYWTSLDMCDDKAEEPDCYLVINLRQDTQGQPSLGNIRVIQPDGKPVEIPGKRQLPLGSGNARGLLNASGIPPLTMNLCTKRPHT